MAERERTVTPPRGGVFVPRTTVMDAADLRRAVTRIAHEIVERNHGLDGVTLVGLQTGGVPLAHRLHEALLDFPEYREQAVVVEGYFLPPQRPPQHPTVVDVLGPDYAHPEAEVYIDNDVLTGEEVEDKDEILRQGQAEIERARQT